MWLLTGRVATFRLVVGGIFAPVLLLQESATKPFFTPATST